MHASSFIHPVLVSFMYGEESNENTMQTDAAPAIVFTLIKHYTTIYYKGIRNNYIVHNKLLSMANKIFCMPSRL